MTAIITTTVSPVLAALFVANDAARSAVEIHQRDVLDVPAPDDMTMEERNRQTAENNRLNDELCKVHYAVAHHSAETLNDLKGKITFMVKEQMGEGQDWLPTILEDLERIEPAATIDWRKGLERYEQTTASNRASHVVLVAAERAREIHDNEETQKVEDAAEKLVDATCTEQCAAIRALILPPAPNLSALLVNMQIAIDTGMIACSDLNDALSADLRRFSHYANQEI